MYHYRFTGKPKKQTYTKDFLLYESQTSQLFGTSVSQRKSFARGKIFSNLINRMIMLGKSKAYLYV